jgi:hypothetical protein
MGSIRHDQTVIKTLVVALAMVMRHELVNRLPQRAFSEEDHPVQAGFFDASDKAFRMRIQIRRPWRQFHRLHPAGGQRSQKPAVYKRVAVVNPAAAGPRCGGLGWYPVPMRRNFDPFRFLSISAAGWIGQQQREERSGATSGLAGC